MFDEKTGRILTITSTEPVVVIYTGNFLDKKYNGICFEMQDYPDIFNLEPSKVKIYNKKIDITLKLNIVLKGENNSG